jgi:hypothetical protein
MTRQRLGLPLLIRLSITHQLSGDVLGSADGDNGKVNPFAVRPLGPFIRQSCVLDFQQFRPGRVDSNIVPAGLAVFRCCMRDSLLNCLDCFVLHN